MKKYFCLALMAMFMTSVFACSDDEETINPVSLPQTAQSFISQHFAGNDIKRVEKDNDHSGTEYKVYFADGYEVEFNASGEWTDVDAPAGRVVPAGVVPAPIAECVASKFPNDGGVNEISREYSGYDVELISGRDLKFNSEGVLISPVM